MTGETLAAALGEDAGTLEDVRTVSSDERSVSTGLRGRMATEAAYRHLGYTWNQAKTVFRDLIFD